MSPSIAVICASQFEIEACQSQLDELHASIQHEDEDFTTQYSSGLLGKHQVILARFKSRSAGAVASFLRETFPSIRFSILLCTGSSAPQAVVRIGDVVVRDSWKTKSSGLFEDPLTRFVPLPRSLTRGLEKARQRWDAPEKPLDIRPNGRFTTRPAQHRVQSLDRRRPRPIDGLRLTAVEDSHWTYPRIFLKFARLPTSAPVFSESEIAISSETHSTQIAEYLPCIVMRGISGFDAQDANDTAQDYAAATAAAFIRVLLTTLSTDEVDAMRAAAVDSQRELRNGISNIPRMVIPLTGQEHVLNAITSSFLQSRLRSQPRVVVLQGMGSFGKGQLALKYCESRYDRYRSLLWIDCSSEDSALKSLTNFGTLIGGQAPEAPRTTVEIASFVLDWLQACALSCTVVFDDVSYETVFSEIFHLLPKAFKGNVLITTRRTDPFVQGDYIAVDAVQLIGDFDFVSSPPYAELDIVYIETSQTQRRKWVHEWLPRSIPDARIFVFRDCGATLPAIDKPSSQIEPRMEQFVAFCHEIHKRDSPRNVIFVAYGIARVLLERAITGDFMQLSRDDSFVSRISGAIFLDPQSVGREFRSSGSDIVAEEAQGLAGIDLVHLQAEFQHVVKAVGLEIIENVKSPESKEDGSWLTLLDQIQHLRAKASSVDFDSWESNSSASSLRSSWSTSITSQSLIANNASAREAFVEIVMSDPRLQQSFEQMPPSVKNDDLQENLQRLLRELSRNLRREASNSLQRTAARAPKHYAAYTAYQLRSAYAQTEHPEVASFQLEGREDSLPSLKEKIEVLSRDEPTSTGQFSSQELLAEAAAEHDELDVSDDELEVSPQIREAGNFILSSNAYAVFIDAVRAWIAVQVSEALQPAVPQNTNAIIDKDKDNKDDEGDKHNKDEKVVREPVFDTADSSAHLMDSDTSVMEHSLLRDSFWANMLNVQYRMMKAFERKLFGEVIHPLEPGMIRVEWLCTCKQTLACDFDEASLRGAEAWMVELRKANYACRLTSYAAASEGASSPLDSDQFQSNQSEQAGVASSGDASAESNPPGRSSRDKGKQRAPVSVSESPAPIIDPSAVSPPETARWTDAQWTVLAFLVNEPQPLRHVLSTVHKDSSGQRTDAQLVAQWRSHYEEAKGPWWRLFPMTNVTNAFFTRMQLLKMPDGGTEGQVTAPWLPDVWQRPSNEWSPCPSSCLQFDERATQRRYINWILHYWGGAHDSPWVRLRTQVMQSLVNLQKDCLPLYNTDTNGFRDSDRESRLSTAQDNTQRPDPRFIQRRIPQRLQELLEAAFEDPPDAWGICLLEDIDPPNFVMALFYGLFFGALASIFVIAVEVSVKMGMSYFSTVWIGTLTAFTFFFTINDKVFAKWRRRTRPA